MAKPREARGWFVYAVGVALAILMLAFRLYYADGRTSPSLLFPWIDIPFVLAILAGVIATLGLSQGLWYSLVKPGGTALFVASVLMFVVATLFFYALPAHLASRTFFFLMFTAALVLYLYVPSLSWDSTAFLGIGVAGAGLVLATSLYGPLNGFSPLMNPVVLATIATEGLLVVTLLRLLQLNLQHRRPAPA